MMESAKEPTKKESTARFRLEIFCFWAALCFCVGNTLDYVSTGMMRRGPGGRLGGNDWSYMDGVSLVENWRHHEASARVEIIGGFISCAGWLLFSIPIVQLAVVMSNGGKRRLWLHSLMVTLAVGGSMAKFVSRLMHVGVWMTLNWMSDDFVLDSWYPKDGSPMTTTNYLGWKSLEVMYHLTRGATRWVNSFEHLCLFGIFVLYFISVRSLPSAVYTSFGRALAWLGLLVSFGCLANFIVTDMSLEGFKAANIHKISQIMAVASGAALLPLWLLVMSWRLPHAVQCTEEYHEAGEKANQGLDSNLPVPETNVVE